MFAAKSTLAHSILQRIVHSPDGRPPFEVLHGFTNQDNPEPESSGLEFKCGGRTERDIKGCGKNWSKALSAFANTDGGVLIFGFETSKKDGIDYAKSLDLLSNVNAFQSKLEAQHREATDPPVPGVQFYPIPNPTNLAEGFLVCFIPESPFKPHCALLSDNKFYLRSSASSYRVTTGTLRHLFYPRTRSLLIPRVKFVEKKGSNTNVSHFQTKLVNRGTQTAREIQVKITKGFVFSHAQANEADWLCSNKSDTPTFLCRSNLHPGPETLAFRIPLHKGDEFRILQERQNFCMELMIYSLDQLPIRAKIQMTPDECQSGEWKDCEIEEVI